MLDPVTSLLTAVRTRPAELPIQELAELRRNGIDVGIDRRTAETVVSVARRIDPRLETLSP